MKLFTFVATQLRREDLSFVTCYDPEEAYGFSLTLSPLDDALEIAVADQSCYHSPALSVDLHRHFLVATLPKGTIDPRDGEDTYEVHFRIENNEYAALIETLKYLLNGRGTLNIHEE